MKATLFHSSYVIDLFKFVNTNKVDQYFEKPFEFISNFSNEKYSSVSDWELCFKAFYVEGSQIRVFKSLKPYVSDKEKIITIHVPIPSKEDISWGLPKKLLVPHNIPDKILKNGTSFHVDFGKSNSLLNHIIDCLKFGILFSFHEGFTLMGNKIIIKEGIFDKEGL